MKDEISELMRGILGRPCCRKMAGAWRSLSLGFGEKIYHDQPGCAPPYYGEWEIGTYHRSWRIMKDDMIICGCEDTFADDEELNLKVNEIEFGPIKAITQPGGLDVRVELDNGVCVDFLAATSDGDEIFHIFCPQNRCVTFSDKAGWEVFDSSVPTRGMARH